MWCTTVDNLINGYILKAFFNLYRSAVLKMGIICSEMYFPIILGSNKKKKKCLKKY